MPGHSFAQREASRSLSEPARIVNFHDLDPEEDFSTCVHLTKGSQPRRCKKPLAERDRLKVRVYHSKIRRSLDDGVSLRDLLLELAKVTLCNHVHRPNDGMDTLCERVVCSWSGDLGLKDTAVIRSTAEKVVRKEARVQADSLSESPLTSSNTRDRHRNNIRSNTQESAPSDIRRRKPLPNNTPELDDDSSGAESALTIPSNDVRNHKSSTSKREPQTDQLTRLRSLPGRIERPRYPASSYAEYLLYPHKLQGYSPAQLTKYINQTLVSRLARPFTSMCKLDGYVYIFTRPGDASLVKIGFTRNSPEGRVSQWGTKCFYESKREFATKLIPHAWLLEKIVEIVLAKYRREEQQCKWNANCATKHKEWYEISVDKAIKVIKRWAAWITTYRPWGPDYTLKREWMSLLDEYCVAAKCPNQGEDMWDPWLRMEGPRTLVRVIRTPPTRRRDEEEQVSDTIRTLTRRQHLREQSSTETVERVESIKSKPSQSSARTTHTPRPKTTAQHPSPSLQVSTTTTPKASKTDSIPSSSSSVLHLQITLPTTRLPRRTLKTLLTFDIPSSPTLPASPTTLVH